LKVWIEFYAEDIETVKAIMGTLYDRAKKGDITSDVKITFEVEEIEEED